MNENTTSSGHDYLDLDSEDQSLVEKVYNTISSRMRKTFRKSKLGQGQKLYRCIGWFWSITKAQSSEEESSEIEFADTLHNAIIEIVPRFGLTWNDLMQYNVLWWNSPNQTINLVIPYYTIDMILNENPYKSLFTSLNRWVITTNSQTHRIQSDLTPDHPNWNSVLKSSLTNPLNPNNPNRSQAEIDLFRKAQWFNLQRPYLTFLCTQAQAERFLKIDDPFLGVGVVSCFHSNTITNVVTRSNFDSRGWLCVTYKTCPELQLVIPTTHTIRQNDPDYDFGLIDPSRLITNSHKIGISEVNVFYQYWNCKHHSDPTEYMLQTVLNVLAL